VRSAPLLRGIYGIVDDATVVAPLPFTRALLAGGIRIVQYRAKRGVDRALLRAMLERTRASSALLIVNDDLEAALEADGWHAGQEDLVGIEVLAARQCLAGRLFGISAGVPAEAVAAEAAGADYVGVGPFAATGSKLDAGVAIGAAGIAAVAAATSLPVVAIGGIDLGSLDAVASAGAAMAAVISAFARAPDPQAAAHAFVARWRELTE
jgi:thiamine-phosphate pyrophosphorylase